jgi:hypothetical protein
VLKLIAIGSVLLGLRFPGAVSGELAKTALAATKTAITDAKNCDEETARRLSHVLTDTANLVASAAFDSCRNYWDIEQKAYSELIMHLTPNQNELDEQPDLLSEWTAYTRKDAEINSIEARERSEIDRLLPLIVETRRKSVPAVPGK